MDTEGEEEEDTVMVTEGVGEVAEEALDLGRIKGGIEMMEEKTEELGVNIMGAKGIMDTVTAVSQQIRVKTKLLLGRNLLRMKGFSKSLFFDSRVI